MLYYDKDLSLLYPSIIRIPFFHEKYTSQNTKQYSEIYKQTVFKKDKDYLDFVYPIHKEILKFDYVIKNNLNTIKLDLYEMFNYVPKPNENIKIGFIDKDNIYHYQVSQRDYIIDGSSIYITPKFQSTLKSFLQDLIINFNNTEIIQNYLEPLSDEFDVTEYSTTSIKYTLKGFQFIENEYYPINEYNEYENFYVKYFQNYKGTPLNLSNIQDLEEFTQFNVSDIRLPVTLSDNRIFLSLNDSDKMYSKHQDLKWVSPFQGHRKQFLLIRQADSAELSIPQRFDVQFGKFLQYLYDEQFFIPETVRIILSNTSGFPQTELNKRSKILFSDFYDNEVEEDINQYNNDLWKSTPFIYDEPIGTYSQLNYQEGFNENINTLDKLSKPGVVENIKVLIQQYLELVYNIPPENQDQFLTQDRDFSKGHIGLLRLYYPDDPLLNSKNNIVGFINYQTRNLLFTYNRFIKRTTSISPFYGINDLQFFREFYIEYLYTSTDKYYRPINNDSDVRVEQITSSYYNDERNGFVIPLNFLIEKVKSNETSNGHINLSVFENILTQDELKNEQLQVTYRDINSELGDGS